MHFGIISPPVSGHIHPMAVLGRELIARGHRVTYLQMLDLEEKIRSEGLEFEPIGEDVFPKGWLPQSLAALGRLKGSAALRFTVGEVTKTTEAICRDAPAAIKRLAIDALIVDQTEPAGGSVAEHLGRPFVTVCPALPLNRDEIAPPPFTGWRYRDSPFARVRNRLGYAVADWTTSRVAAVLRRYREAWGLAAHEMPDDSFSRLAQISQMPRELDFPRRSLPESFHYVGPLRDSRTREIPFPWDRLDGRPIVFASLGTLQNSRAAVFRRFCDACRPLKAQVVVSHGGGLTEAEAASLPGDPLVVPYAPQTALLERASLTLTHAGLNTVLDSLAAGVPVVAVPITYEQPAIARRLEA
ncbi:MAG TPA: glycosyltransferase, partial [Vicinamibacterales bacterium]|nr:glycosyltransferase [Vicinamibacterales bacterium]